jgi:hypothetical protein
MTGNATEMSEEISELFERWLKHNSAAILARVSEGYFVQIVDADETLMILHREELPNPTREQIIELLRRHPNAGVFEWTEMD